MKSIEREERFSYTQPTAVKFERRKQCATVRRSRTGFLTLKKKRRKSNARAAPLGGKLPWLQLNGGQEGYVGNCDREEKGESSAISVA